MKCQGESGKFFKSEGVQQKEVKASILLIMIPQLTIYWIFNNNHLSFFHFL